MKVAITGGAGFFGLHLANHFDQKKEQVSLIDIQAIKSDEYRGKPTYFNIDIRNYDQLSKALSGHDIVIHAAAALPLWKKEDIISTNVTGTKNVLKSAQKNKVKRVIYISSTAVYGVPKKHPIEESDPLIGVGTYGETKINAEKLCQEFMDNGLNITIIRPKTFVGTARLGVFEILFDWIHDGKKIPIIGNGSNHYQLLDVDDLVDAVYLFSSNNRTSYNQAFNIGAAKYNTISEDLQELFDHAKSGSTLLPLPPKPIKLTLKVLESLNLSPLYQWVYDTADTDSFVSIKKLTKVLKWSPKFSNAQALIKSYDWYQDHYREIKSRKSGVTHTVGWKQGALAIAKKFL